MQEDRLIAGPDNFEGQGVAVSVAGREFRQNVEVAPIAVPNDSEALALWPACEVFLFFGFDFRAIRGNSLGYEFLTLS